MKALFIILGTISLLLGIVGIILPLLPTTPFLLLSATLFLHSSPKLYTWLVSSKYLGKYIRDYKEHRAIPMKSKVVILTLMWTSLTYCTFWIVPTILWAQISLGCVGIGVTWHVLSLKTRR